MSWPWRWCLVRRLSFLPRRSPLTIPRAECSSGARDHRFRGVLFFLTVGAKFGEISNEIIAIRFLGKSGENHFRAGNYALRIGKIFLELRLVPGNSRVLISVGIIITLYGARRAPDQPVQLGSDKILGAFANLMADLAFCVEDRFAGGGIRRHSPGNGTGPGGRGDKADIFTLHIRFPSL